MRIVRTAAEAAAAARALPRPVGLVPTMGALHTGHLALVQRARAASAGVVATIFVNPLQFGPGEDFERYPRAFAGDAEQLEAAGVDLLFAPAVDEVYPAGFETAVDPGPIATRYEGAIRPGHFRGVATVCLKLFQIVAAERAYFGEKDAQQLAVLRQIVRDLNVPLAIEAVATVRESDGLALSSRNVYLTGNERAAAPALYRALTAMADAALRGETMRDRIVAAGRAQLAPATREAYLDVVDARAFRPLELLTGDPAEERLAIGSVWVGSTRILDNVALPAPPTVAA